MTFRNDQLYYNVTIISTRLLLYYNEYQDYKLNPVDFFFDEKESVIINYENTFHFTRNRIILLIIFWATIKIFFFCVNDVKQKIVCQ